MSPTNAQPGPSSTPPRVGAIVHDSPLKSTPSNRGTASISSHIRLLGTKIGDLRPWIKRDVAEADRRPVDEMLSTLLQRASNDPKTKQTELLPKCLNAVLNTCNKEPRIQEALDKYVSASNEGGYYGPFIDAANVAFECLAKVDVEGMRAVSELDIICQRNDPRYMTQFHEDQQSLRKPDVVVIPFSYKAFPKTEDMCGPREQRLDHAKKAPEESLVWTDPLACIEFKRSLKTLPRPKETYTVAEYLPTKPEYRTLDGDSASSVTPATAEKATSRPQSGQHAPAVELRRSARSSTQNSSNQSNKRKAEEAGHTTSGSNKRPKADSNEDELDVTVQTGLYAAEMFAANLAATRVINLIVVDNILWVWYYDRQGIIQSSGIDFLGDRPRFMVLLYALQRLRLDDWGRNTAFMQHENGQSYSIVVDGVDLELHTSHEDRVTRYGLKGRATNVFPVTSKALLRDFPHVKGDGMIAKIFWAEEQRTSEPDILKKANEIAEEYPITVKGHIPDLLWHCTIDEPTSKVRELLGVPEPTEGSRVLYILVFRKLRPITELQGKDFFDVWQQCINCHFDLWHAKGGIHHRDISAPNLMYRREEDGTLIGVLNDYDLSSFADAQSPRGNERTGTVPFMALDLLTHKGQQGKVKHLYRHDLESFVWVLPWVVLRYRDGKLLTSCRPLDEWATKDAQTVYKEKTTFLNDFFDSEPPGVDQRMWLLVMECLDVLRKENYHRQGLKIEQRKRRREAEITDIERDDATFLDLFESTDAWIELGTSLQ